ncbi:hypothetical protein MLD38_038731 [Melastoma candidum]|uniref:Uncharacterized protein n=1 Tax=Melastoma candidum TaxID=119954 RepID=A0ACB9L113_9MYRT|nr:hypothetical protein MLD38_038731 [Melastoma candidum]
MESAGVISGKSVFGVPRASRPSRGFLESRVVPGKVSFFGGKLGSCGGIGGLRSGFGDDGHVRYYSDGGARCVVEGGCRMKKKGEEGKVDEGKIEKKRMKLLEGLSRDLAMFMEMGFGVDDDDGDVDQGKKISESAEILLKHLELLKAEQKELKRNKKEEKIKQKAERMKDMIQSESSSSSSESSDSECGEVVNMSCLKESFTKQLQEEPGTTTLTLVAEEVSSSNLVMAKEHPISCGSAEVLSDNMDQFAPESPRIEVCMGNKCKKSGSIELLAEFERVVGLEGAVVGCKCLGKCRDGPNVRVLNSSDKNQAESAVLDDSVRTPTNPLCIGVGLEDVGVIVASFLAKDRDLGLDAAVA